MKKIILALALLTLLSCENEETKTVTCTIYLNGVVWSKKTVDKCENCFAPQGYTTKCE